MKKVLRNILVCSALALTLSSCSKVSQSYADKINAAYATSSKDDDYTYKKVVSDLGKNWVLNVSNSESDDTPTGAITWAEGCKSPEDYQKKIEDGKKVKTIVVTFLDGRAVKAIYVVADPSTSEKK